MTNPPLTSIAVTTRPNIKARYRIVLKGRSRSAKFLALEKKHKEGYLSHPVKKGEFDIFEKEQEWG